MSNEIRRLRQRIEELEHAIRTADEDVRISEGTGLINCMEHLSKDEVEVIREVLETAPR